MQQRIWQDGGMLKYNTALCCAKPPVINFVISGKGDEIEMDMESIYMSIPRWGMGMSKVNISPFMTAYVKNMIESGEPFFLMDSKPDLSVLSDEVFQEFVTKKG